MRKENMPLIPRSARLNSGATIVSQVRECLSIQGRFLGNDIITLSQTSKFFHAFFTPELLLLYVANGNERLVNKIAKKNPMLLLKATYVTDFAGRYFQRITAYQYALWAGDKDIVKLIEQIACKVKGAEGENLRAALLLQWRALKNDGIRYILNGNTHYEAAYNPAPLFQAYTEYIIKYSNLAQTNIKELGNKWSQGVGIQQKLMPVHAILKLGHQSEYYNRIFKVYNPKVGKTEFDLCAIASPKKGLGFNFALIRAQRKECQVDVYVTDEEAWIDKDTLVNLFEAIQAKRDDEPVFKETPDKCLPCVIL